MSASSASSLGTDALAPLNRGWSSRLSRYETERSVAVVSEHDAWPTSTAAPLRQIKHLNASYAQARALHRLLA